MFYVYRGIGDSWFFNFTKTFFLSCNILYQFFPTNALGWLISTHCRFKTVNAISILSEVLKVKKNSVVFDEIINKKKCDLSNSHDFFNFFYPTYNNIAINENIIWRNQMSPSTYTANIKMAFSYIVLISIVEFRENCIAFSRDFIGWFKDFPFG